MAFSDLALGAYSKLQAAPFLRPMIRPLPDESATIALGQRLAALARPGDVLALHGDLAAGKTTLARAFIRALTRPDEEVPSPTFTLVQTYDTAVAPIWHFDLYRLSGPDEVFELGFDEALSGGILLIEWPERLGALLPAERLDVTLEGSGPRYARITGHGSWVDRIREFE